MGALCCCFHVHDEQDNNYPSNNASSNNCWLLQKFTSKHRPAQMQAPSSNPSVALNNNSSDANASHSVVGPAFSQEIGTSRSRVQPEPSEQSDDHIRIDQKSRNMYPSLDDEESCLTCFEEYNEENPKTILKCCHHYHLSCIYEWMERSETCPACRKLMLFQESS